MKDKTTMIPRKVAELLADKAASHKMVIDNYYEEIQRLQRENALEKDLIASLERKIRIKIIWNRIWGVLAALLSVLLAIKCI